MNEAPGAHKAGFCEVLRPGAAQRTTGFGAVGACAIRCHVSGLRARAASCRAGRAWTRFLLGGPSPAALRLIGVALGAVGLKDLLWSIVAYDALAVPGRFVWPYLNVPRIPYGGAWGFLPTALQITATLASLALVAGVASRAAAIALFGCYAYSFLGDRLAYTNNVYVFLTFLLAYAAGAGPDPRAGQAAGRFLQLFVASIYLTGGLTKLTPVWLSGAVFREALFNYQEVYRRLIGYDSPAAFRVMACGVVACELFLAFGLWHKKTRPWAVALGVALHAGIELFVPVRMFSYLMVASYALFAERAWARHTSRALDRSGPLTRALAVLGVTWLINRLFVRVTGCYEYTRFADLPLIVSVPIVGLLSRTLPPVASWPVRSRAFAGLKAVLPAVLVLHAALLLKPAFGGRTDFSFRIFTGVLRVRPELWALEGGAWQQRPLDGINHRWNDQHALFIWASWVDERPVFEAYAHWAAGRLEGAEALRLDVQVSEDLAPPRLERWELPLRR